MTLWAETLAQIAVNHAGDGSTLGSSNSKVADADEADALLAAAARLAIEPDSDLFEIACGWEHVLATYNRALRKGHGAFFTPPDLARFVVAAAGQLIERHFPEVSRDPDHFAVVDPAAGSGVFLLETLIQQPAWAPSLAGIEWMSSSAHVAQQLIEASLVRVERSKPHDAGRQAPMVRCGDALACRDPSSLLDGRTPDTLLLLGNPPYSNFRSPNDHSWIGELLGDYKTGLQERKHNLNDDFIKFLRWAQHQVEAVGQGVVALVTNSTDVHGVTQRLMRRS